MGKLEEGGWRRVATETLSIRHCHLNFTIGSMARSGRYGAIGDREGGAGT